MKAKSFFVFLFSAMLLASCGSTKGGTSIGEVTTASANTSAVTTQTTKQTSAAVTTSQTPITSAQTTSPVVESSSGDGLTEVNPKLYPAMFASLGATTTFAQEKAANSVFSMMPGTTYDTGSGKAVTVDGVDYPKNGRLKLNGKGDMTSRSKCVKFIAAAAGTFRAFATSANNSDATRKWHVDSEDASFTYTSAAGVASGGTVETETLEITKAGTYYFYADNGINLYYLDYKEKIALGNEVGFSIGTTAVKSYYLTGDAFSSDGLTVDLAYSSGFAFPAEDMTKVKVDSSAFNKDKAGDYDIKVQYGSYDPQTFKVSVHAVKSIVLYHSPLQASSGKTDVNRTPDVYKVGAVFSSNYLVVKAVADDNKELTVSSATFGAVDLTTAGVKEVKASYINEGVTYTDSFNVTAIDPSLLVASASGSYKVTVNPALTQDGTVDSTTSVMGFKTIQAANDFLAAKAEATAKKEIAVADGTYNEKLYITIPNVSLASASADASKVVVQFDADEDTKDAGGLPFGTACGSVVINSSAKNFSAANITFNNSKFATMAEYTACTDGNKQAIALSCEGDMSAFSHCVFKGFQDTLYAKGAKDSTDTTNTGHQYYNACTISGMTDFIFGDESDCYFKGCTIKCLNRSDAKNGGYICTTKAAAKRTIGFVFDTCTVTPEEGVTDGTVSLGRTWGAGATIKYVNCTLPKAISVSAYPCSTNNARWEAMSGNLPTAAFFTEYNNSGEGAITAAVAGGSLMSDTDYTTLQAAIQTAFSSILA